MNHDFDTVPNGSIHEPSWNSGYLAGLKSAKNRILSDRELFMLARDPENEFDTRLIMKIYADVAEKIQKMIDKKTNFDIPIAKQNKKI